MQMVCAGLIRWYLHLAWGPNPAPHTQNIITACMRTFYIEKAWYCLRREQSVMANNENANHSTDNFIQMKNALLRYFTNQQISQATRLIGFGVVLFALLQTVQHSCQEPLASIFSTMAKIIMPSEVWMPLAEVLKFHLLLILIVILLTYIIRTIIRFSLFSYLAEYLMEVTEPIKESKYKAYKMLYEAASEKLKKRGKKLYWIFPLKWSLPEESTKGWIVCTLASIPLALILLGLLW